METIDESKNFKSQNKYKSWYTKILVNYVHI